MRLLERFKAVSDRRVALHCLFRGYALMSHQIATPR
jgi:hypothetical protein